MALAAAPAAAAAAPTLLPPVARPTAAPAARAQRLLAMATRLRRAETTTTAAAPCQLLHRPRLVAAAASISPSAADKAAAAAVQQEDNTSSSSTSSPPVTPGDVLTLRCARLAGGGRGVCLTGPRGFVVMVPRALPGELLRARITAVRGRFAEGERLETLEPHTAAVPPPCPHFTEGCGGCPLQPLEYGVQLKEKRNSVVQLLSRVGGVKTAEELVNPTVGAPLEGRLGYRNKLQFTFGSTRGAAGEARPTATGSSSAGEQQQQTWALGFLRPGTSDEVLPIHACLLQGPAANRALAAVRNAAARLGLEPADAPSGRGGLRHCIIRSSGRDANDSSSSSSSGKVRLQVVIVTRRCSPDLIRPLAEAVAAAVPEVASVVHSVETDSPGDGRRNGSRGDSGGRASSSKGRRSGGKQRRGRRGSDVGKSSGGGKSSEEDSGSDDDDSGGGRGRGGARPLRVEKSVALIGPPSLDQELSGLRFSVGPHSFFQTSTAMAEVLYGLVADAVASALPDDNTTANATAAAASLDTPPVVLDLYTGTGTIALTLARRLGGRGAAVWGADVNASAIADAARNAAANGVTGAAFVCGDLDTLAAKDLVGAAAVPGAATPAAPSSPQTKLTTAGVKKPAGSPVKSAKPARPAAVVVDPARAGLGAPVIEFLRRCRAPVIVYVSCNPATQARDIARLAGAYEIASVTPVDMFPQTEHVETVAVLRRL